MRDDLHVRHGRARPGHPRRDRGEDVDARDKPGHDVERERLDLTVRSPGMTWRERAGRNSAAHSATHIFGIADFTVVPYGLRFVPRARHGPEPPYGLPSWLAAAAFRLVNSGDIYQARLRPWADRSLIY